MRKFTAITYSLLMCFVAACKSSNQDFLKYIESGQEQEAITLVNTGAVKINYPIENAVGVRYRPIHYAVMYGQEILTQRLIYLGVDVNAQDNINLHAPIHLAVLNSSPNLLQLLIAAECNMDPLDENMQTPLMIAVIKDNYEIATLLLRNGADAGYTLPSGRTLFDWAKSMKMRDLLESHQGV